MYRRLEKLLVENGGEFYTGVAISQADIAVFNFVDLCAPHAIPRFVTPPMLTVCVRRMTTIDAGVLAGFPALVALKERVAAIPNIAKYLATRA